MEQTILFKLPSRTRPKRVFEVLDATLKNLGDKINFHFLLTLDVDDLSMNNNDVRQKLDTYPNMNYVFDYSSSKIEAVNRDLNDFTKPWDILVLLSDDMVPIKENFDNIIREKFDTYFSDLDGVTWFNDGFQKNKINTLCILGKKYYKRFNYIYHPSYKSLYCDNEFTIVANLLGKQKYFEEVIIEHRHFSIGANQERYDDLYRRNDALMNADGVNYFKRERLNFELNG